MARTLTNDSGQQTAIADFFAGSSTSREGVRVMARDFDGDGKDELVTGDADGNTIMVYEGSSLATDDTASPHQLQRAGRKDRVGCSWGSRGVTHVARDFNHISPTATGSSASTVPCAAAESDSTTLEWCCGAPTMRSRPASHRLRSVANTVMRPTIG